MQYTAYNLPIIPPPKNLCKVTACSICSILTAMILLTIGFTVCMGSCSVSSNFPFSCTKNGDKYCCGSFAYGPYSCGMFNNCNLDNTNCTIFWVGAGIFFAIFVVAMCYSFQLRKEHQRQITQQYNNAIASNPQIPFVVCQPYQNS